MNRLFPLSILFFSTFVAGVTCKATENGQIVVGKNAGRMEVYAGRELRKYLYALSGQWLPIVDDEAPLDKASFVLGQSMSNARIAQLSQMSEVRVTPEDPGPQGYVLHKSMVDDQEVLVIAGSDAAGVLYGVYGLLDDHYGIGFYMSGDVIPEQKQALRIVSVSERKAPRQRLRGFTNHWCYMQGSGLWSLEDWKYHIDQMARMRMNLLSIHNYIFEGYREIYLNWGDYEKRNWNQTSITGGQYHPAFRAVREYPWRTADFINDYAFGAAATLHNSSLSNSQVWEKCASTFQKIIDYAHGKGVMVALGTEFHLLEDAELLQICDSMHRWYPELDYLVYYRHEHHKKKQKTAALPRVMYDYFKKHLPETRHVLTGWGPIQIVPNLPKDVIYGPFGRYNGIFEDGSRYGDYEYWSGPWLEDDGSGAMHYASNGRCKLSDTLACYQKHAPNMNGIVTLTWRVTDAIDPKMAYIAKAPWDLENEFSDSRAVYLDYARQCYGEQAAEAITDIINHNEANTYDAGDCKMRHVEPVMDKAAIKKADAQIKVIDECIAESDDRGNRYRLGLLRNRLLGVKLHTLLADKGDSWDHVPNNSHDWMQTYLNRAVDMSTIGQMVSHQHMMMKMVVARHVEEVQKEQKVRIPSLVRARGTTDGAIVSWEYDEEDVAGFNLYRDGSKITELPLKRECRVYSDKAHGRFRYTVTAVNLDGVESLQSLTVPVRAGKADSTAPLVIVVSPPTSAIAGQPVDIETRVNDDRAYEQISAVLHYRTVGTKEWSKVPMARRCRAIFASRVPGDAVTAAGIEYFISASDGLNTGMHPATAPGLPAFIVVESVPVGETPAAPKALEPDSDGRTLRWEGNDDKTFWYRIYRGRTKDFSVGPQNELTYVYKNTHRFRDLEPDFEDKPLEGTYHYRVTAVSRDGIESSPSASIEVRQVPGPTPNHSVNQQ